MAATAAAHWLPERVQLALHVKTTTKQTLHHLL
jgi:hypothetical protein